MPRTQKTLNTDTSPRVENPPEADRKATLPKTTQTLNRDAFPRVEKTSTPASRLQERSNEPKSVKFHNMNEHWYPLRSQETTSGVNYRFSAQHISTQNQ